VKIYTVHELASAEITVEERAESLVFIKEGIAIFAVISPVLWFIWHRLWQALLGYVIILMVLMGGSALAGFNEAQVGIASTMFNLGIGLEANNIRGWFLERGGARMIGVVSGHDLAECEYRFFASWFSNPETEKSLVARLETA